MNDREYLIYRLEQVAQHPLCYDASVIREAIAALSQPVAEAVAWRVIKPCGLRRHMTQAQYDANPELQKWYEPFKCASCRDDVASSGLRGTGERHASR